MFTPHRCTSHITQLFNGEMIPTIPHRGSSLYPDVDPDSNCFCSARLTRDEHIHTNEFVMEPYQISAPQNESWNSTRSSNHSSDISLSESGFDLGFPALDGNTKSILSFSRRSNFALPPKSRPMVSQNHFQDCETTIITGPLPPDLNTNVVSNQVLATQSVDFDGWSESNMWAGGFDMPSLDLPLQARKGFPTEVSDNAGGCAMTCDYDDEYMSCPQQTPWNSSVSPSIPMQHHSSEASLSNIGTPSASTGLWFETGPGRDMERQTQNAEMSLQFLPDNMTVAQVIPSPRNSSLATGDCSPVNVPANSFSEFQKETVERRFCNIQPKPILGPLTLVEVASHSVQSAARNVGRRRGPLKTKVRESANKVRKLRACAHCRTKKIRCSEGIVCDPCLQNHSRRTFQWSGCLRKFLHHYADVFCPTVLFEHLGSGAIKSWIEESGIVNTDNELLVQVSSGLFSNSMLLKVREFHPPSQDVLLLPDLISSNDHGQNFASLPTLPYALHESEVNQVKPKCLEYISAFSNFSLEDAETVIGDTPKIIWKSLECIRRYLRTNLMARRNGLLQKALGVYWTQYALSRTFTLNSQSALNAIARLQESSTILPSQHDISARVLNRQLKGALKLLYEEQLKDLLQSLEKEYKTKSRMSWLLCFCTNLVLCLIVEQLQNAIDGLVSYNICEKGEDPACAVERGMKSCRELEELPIKYSWTMFFGLYKSYNPIKTGCSPDDKSDQNLGEAEIIAAFAQLIRNNEDGLLKKATHPCSGGTSQIPMHHKAFRATNSGRHLAKFLMKFI